MFLELFSLFFFFFFSLHLPDLCPDILTTPSSFGMIEPVGCMTAAARPQKEPSPIFLEYPSHGVNLPVDRSQIVGSSLQHWYLELPLFLALFGDGSDR